MIRPVFPVLIVIICSVFLLSCLSNKMNFQAECVSIEVDGYVTLKIWDTKKGLRYKSEQARKDAIHAILYSGISGGAFCTTQPPVLDQAEEQENFKFVEKKFFAKKGKWSTFSWTSAKETSIPSRLGASQWNIFQVSISKNELRKYLEEKKIIKSLATGF